MFEGQLPLWMDVEHERYGLCLLPWGRQGAVPFRHWPRGLVCPAWTSRNTQVSGVSQIDPRKTRSAEVLVRKGSPVLVCILRTTLLYQVPGRNLWEFGTVEKGAVDDGLLQSQGLQLQSTGSSGQ